MNKKSKQIIKTLIIVVSMAAFLSLAMILVVNKKKSQNTNTIINEQVQNTTEGEKQIDTSNWETYTNPTYGYSFKYPKEIKIQEFDTSKYVDSYKLLSNEITEESLSKRPNKFDTVNIAYLDNTNNSFKLTIIVKENVLLSLTDYFENQLEESMKGEKTSITNFHGNTAYTFNLIKGGEKITYLIFKSKNNMYIIQYDESNIYKNLLESFEIES